MARELQIIITASTQQAEDALKRAERALDAVETQAESASRSMSGMDKASGTTAKNTNVLNQGMDVLTKSVMQFASAAAIGAAIDQAIEFGSAVNDLSARTGIGTDALQSLGFVAEQTGSSMEAFARSVSFLDKTLEAGGQKAVNVVSDLGLSVEELLMLSPEDRFRKVAIAIGEIEDPAQRAYAATALFGRAGAELIPMFAELAQGAEDVSLVMDREVISILDEAGDAMNYVTQAGKAFVGTFVAVGYETLKLFGEPFRLVATAIRGIDDELLNLSQSLPKVPSIAKQLMPPGLASVAVDDFDKVSSALDRQRKEAERAAKEAERLAAAQEKARLASIVWGDGIEYASKWVERLDAEIAKLHRGGVTRLTDILEFDRTPVDQATAALVKFQGSIRSFSSQASGAWTGFARTVQQETPAVTKSFDNVREALQNLPSVILGAIQGGGNVLKSVGASIGQSLAVDLVSNFGSKLPGMMGGILSTLAGPLGSMFGAWAGDLAGKLFGRLFGPSQMQQVEDMRRRFLDAGGGLQAMQDRADAAGVSMQALFNARTTSQFQSAMNAFNESLRESEERTQKTKEAMERWGLTIDQMGPKFAQQDINRKLLSIVGDMELLTSAGADFNLVAEKMAPEINKLVRASITAGTEVPREMEPILRKMFDLGLLTNESGDKLEDFGEITFATDINRQFLALISKMDELLSKLFGVGDESEEAFDRFSGAVQYADGTLQDFAARTRDAITTQIVPALESAEDTLNGFLFGHSPGGLKEIPILTREAGRAMRDFETTTTDTFKNADASLNRLLSGIRNFGSAGFSRIRVDRNASEQEQAFQRRFEGFVDPRLGIITEADAIKRIREVSALYGQQIDEGFARRILVAYGYKGGGRVLRDRLDEFLQEVSRKFIEESTVGFDQGGMVGRDFRRPSSRDVIPALLRPGEVVLTPEQARMSPRAASNITVNVSVAGYLDSFEARSNLATVVRDELSKTLRRTGRAA